MAIGGRFVAGLQGYTARIVLAGSVAFVFSFAGTAQAAGPAEICRSFERNSNPIDADPDAMRTSAELVERRLVARRSSLEGNESDLSLLNLPEAAGPQASADLATRAAYCAAAGELMRTDKSGSDFRAQAYLLSAFRMAEAAGNAEIASRAAYRLGLVSVNVSSIPATRGERRSSVGTRAAVENMAEVGAIGSGVCGTLSGVRLGVASPQYLSALSLECASARGASAGDFGTASLAQLRLARMELAMLARTENRQEFLRGSIGESLSRGLGVVGNIADPVLRAEITGRMVETALDSNTIDAARLEAAASAMRADAKGDPATTAYAEALTARLALLTGETQNARAAANRAIFIEAQRSIPLRLPEWYLVLASVEPENRTAHILEAYRALEAIRPSLPPTDFLTEESTFSLRMRKVFEQAVDVTLASAETADSDVILAAQAIVETYREAEIQSIFGSECVPLRVAFTPADLAAGEVLLYPILLPDRLETIVAERPTDGGPARYRRLQPNLSVSRQQIAVLVEQVNIAMSEGDNEDWYAAARKLDALLIEPIESSLDQAGTLIIIPDGPLRALPFAALPDVNGKFLIERTKLGVSPALGYSQPGGGAREGSLRVVAASLQKRVELLGGVFPALEGTAEEARIAAASGNVDGSRLIEDFQRDDLIEALTGRAIDVLHLATHASFNGGSDRSFIVANGESIPLSELRALIAANLARGGALDLIVLSACETAVGDDEASMGLAGAAVQAGASSAIASLWQVNDVGTAELMRQFYLRYSAGMSKSQALRDAQLALLSSDDFADPNIWAAFTLLGGWR